MVALNDSYCGLFMAQTSDNLARKYGISRQCQDEFALRSHSLSNQANTNGRFAEETFRCRSCKARRRRPSTRTTTSSPARRSRG